MNVEDWAVIPGGRALRSAHDHIMDSKVWGEIRREAKTNKVLQDARERVIILYHLSKEHGPK